MRLITASNNVVIFNNSLFVNIVANCTENQNYFSTSNDLSLLTNNKIINLDIIKFFENKK